MLPFLTVPGKTLLNWWRNAPIHGNDVPVKKLHLFSLFNTQDWCVDMPNEEGQNIINFPRYLNLTVGIINLGEPNTSKIVIILHSSIILPCPGIIHPFRK